MIIETANKQDYAFIKSLYNTAFPSDERAPFFLIRRRAKQGRSEMLIAREDGRDVGFACVVTHEDMAYLFYFAVDAGKRGAGNGSKILQLLKERYAGKRLFLAREQLDESADNYTQRVKRHEFYLKNGLSDWTIRIKEANVIYDVMGIGGMVTPAEYDALITGWSGKLLRRMIDMRVLE